MSPPEWRGRSSAVWSACDDGGGARRRGGGLSAAHELAERGFDVTVYEARDGVRRQGPLDAGAGLGAGGRADLPAEHGFRFFPGFYRHLPDTMARIPHGWRSVADHLVPATRILLAQAGGRDELIAAAQRAVVVRRPRGDAPSSRATSAQSVGIPAQELAQFIERMLTLLVSCDERRLEQWERASWWEYVAPSGAPRRSRSSSPTA